MNYSGKLILVIGAAGSGKGALMKQTKKLHTDIIFPISATTRPMRPNESNGQTYLFISKEEFQALIDSNQFLEWAHIDQHMYGTPRSEVIPALETGKIAIKEMDVQGVECVQHILPKENLVTIYIDAGPWKDLEGRIRGRAPISDEELESRRTRFEYEKEFMNHADHIVQNFDGAFKEADAAFEKVLSHYLSA